MLQLQKRRPYYAVCGAGPHEGRQAFPLTQNGQTKKRQGDIENRRPIKKTDEERNSSMAKTGKLKRVTSLMLALVLAVSPVTAYATDSTAEVASETEPSAGYETEYETDYEQEAAAEGYVSEEEEYEEDPAPEEDAEAGEAQDIPEESDEEDVFESGSEDVDDIEDPYIEEEGEEAQEDEYLEEDQTERLSMKHMNFPEASRGKIFPRAGFLLRRMMNPSSHGIPSYYQNITGSTWSLSKMRKRQRMRIHTTTTM